MSPACATPGRHRLADGGGRHRGRSAAGDRLPRSTHRHGETHAGRHLADAGGDPPRRSATRLLLASGGVVRLTEASSAARRGLDEHVDESSRSVVSGRAPHRLGGERIGTGHAYTNGDAAHGILDGHSVRGGGDRLPRAAARPPPGPSRRGEECEQARPALASVREGDRPPRSRRSGRAPPPGEPLRCPRRWRRRTSSPAVRRDYRGRRSVRPRPATSRARLCEGRGRRRRSGAGATRGDGARPARRDRAPRATAR